MSNNVKAPRQRVMRGPMGGNRGGMPGERPKDFKGTLAKTVRYMRKDLVAIIISFVLAIGGVVATLVVPDILGRATDKLMTGAFQKTAYNTVTSMRDEVAANGDALEQLAPYADQTFGFLRNYAKETDPEGNYVYPIPDEQREMLLSLPEFMFSVKVGDFLKSGEAKTMGELAELLNLMPVLNQIPEAYRDAVLATSLAAPPTIDVAGIVDILIKIIILVCASGAMAYAQGFILAGVAQRISYRFRKDINAKLDKLPLKYFDKTTNGEVMSFITNDVDTISTSLNQSLTQIITSVTTLIGVLIMMFKISWILTLISLLVLPITMVMVMLIVKKSQGYFINQQIFLGHVNGHIEEMYSGHNVVKLFNGEQKSVEEFTQFNEELYKANWNSQFYSGIMMPVMKLIGNVSYVVICVVGGVLVINGRLSIGNIQSFSQYIKQFTQPLQQVAGIANTFQSTVAAAERVFGFLEEGEESEESALIEGEVRGNVDFENVRFGYDADKIIINDFSCEVTSGQQIAIVGPTGAGKTTIVKLLMRFYELQGGKIKLDGRDITEISRDSLRENVGMVLQDTWLFSGTIMENIRYGRLEASDEEVVNAAKTACADHFINTLPGGYGFEINADADNISQGQKQLLTIARAILSDPKVLILDEATSSVDTRTEVLIQRAMDALMSGRTSFVIAHRLSTIRSADAILVLKDGDVVEQGSHAQLMARGGFYAELYNAQFES